MKKKNNYKSDCCRAKVRFSDFAPDFIGDDPKTMKIGTCYYICTKCEEACDIYIPIRKVWARNPSEQIIGNKRKKVSVKLTDKEIKEILKNEDF
jgi:CO dehydrogenase/acetyl-CoA synthase alpha subunit